MKLRAMCLAMVPLFAAACDDNNNENRADAGAGTGGVSSSIVTRTDLASDQAGAAHADPKLINAWGLAFGPTGTAWVAANGSGVIQLYDSTGTPSATLPSVTIPLPAGATGTATPTGQVFNGNAALFAGDTFIVATEDGTIAGWQQQDGATAMLRVDNSHASAIYKGITIGTLNGVWRLYAADFHNARVDVFDSNYAPLTLTNAFVDPNLPAGFAPFNVYAVGSKIYVSYAKQSGDAVDDVKGPGNGFIDVYDFDGAAQARLVSQGALNSPWGMVLAPANFGAASNTLIVGNFGDGRIHSYTPDGGQLVTTFKNGNGSDVTIDGLWSLVFGGGQSGEAGNQLFFTAGPADEMHGVFGRMDLSTGTGTTTP